jgi:hypothetical protein
MRKDVRGESRSLQDGSTTSNVNAFEMAEILKEPLNLSCRSGQRECEKGRIVLRDNWRRGDNGCSSGCRGFGLGSKKSSHHSNCLLSG